MQDACSNRNHNNRFVIGLSIAVRQQYGGQRLYVYGQKLRKQHRLHLAAGLSTPIVPVAPAVSDSVYYIHTDRLGSNVIMTDANANVVAKTDYTLTVQRRTTAARRKHRGYTGQYEDPLTGLTYMQARYYDADLGRFISTDPVAARAGDVFNFNRVCVCERQSLNFTDPTGMDTCAAFVNGIYDSTGECDAAVSPPSGGGGGVVAEAVVEAGSGPSEGGMPGFEFDRTPTEKPGECDVNVTADRPPDPAVPIETLPPFVFRLPPSRPIFTMPWYRPVLRKADDILSRKLLERLSFRTLTFDSAGEVVAARLSFFVWAVTYSPALGGCDGAGRCADEYNQTMPMPSN